MRKKRNILIFYDDRELYANTVLDHLNSFRFFSNNDVYYAGGCAWSPPPLMPINSFDIVVIHYSVRLAVDWFIHPDLPPLLQEFSGLKVLFVQDEYQHTENTCKWIEIIGFHFIFTCIPDQFVPLVYPPDRFHAVQFVNVLTGYVPIELENNVVSRPLDERHIWIGYRGRSSRRYYLGLLGQEKVEIGVRMKAMCLREGIPCDIEWDEHKRIYGSAWYDFISSCRTQLGVESGCNVVDRDGTIQAKVESAIRRNPDASFQDIYERFVKPFEGPMRMNQISPRIFESIALGTGLILFEGEYSGVIQPNYHFIPLKKDFSNADEVLERLSDLDSLNKMILSAHEDIVASGRFSYRVMIKKFDDAIGKCQRTTTSQHQFVKSILCRTALESEDFLQPKCIVTTAPVRVPEDFFKTKIQIISQKFVKGAFSLIRIMVRIFLPREVRRVIGNSLHRWVHGKRLWHDLQ